MTLDNFILQSWAIEGEFLGPTDRIEITTHVREFLKRELTELSVLRLMADVFKGRIQLRSSPGMDVRVGSHNAPPGGPNIGKQLNDLLEDSRHLTPFELYCRFETLHPFTDGNGRMGRFVWLHKMGGNVDLLFLQAFHYQALDAWDR